MAKFTFTRIMFLKYGAALVVGLVMVATVTGAYVFLSLYARAPVPSPVELAHFKDVVHNTTLIPLIMDGVLGTPVVLPVVTTDAAHWQQDSDAITVELLTLKARLQQANCVAKLTPHFDAMRIQLVVTITCP